jgi:thiamine biosynthesis protein ThiS
MSETILVTVNQQPRHITADSSLEDALIAWGFSLDVPMALAINHQVIRRQAFATQRLQAGDVLDLVLPTPGG